MIRSLQLDTEISSRKGTGEVESLFGGKLFSFPKPTELIRRYISVATTDNDIILDFFAGSATTAHSVYKINNQDRTNRRFIMVQLPEMLSEDSEAYRKGYRKISELTIERIRKAGELFKDSSHENFDYGVKMFRLDRSNIKVWDGSHDELSNTLDFHQDSIVENRSSHDVLVEVLLKYGLDLTYPIAEHTLAGKSVYDVAFGSLIVCLDDDISQDVVEEIGKLKQELDSESTRVVFKDSGFADDAVKVNAVQLLKQYGVDDVKSI